MTQHDDDIEHIYLDDEDQHPTPQHHSLHKAVETDEEYKKFKRVLLGILVVSALLTTVRGWELERFMADFMAVFFIAFAAFKFTDLEGFAVAYRGYDLLAQKIRPWAYAFPFVEAFLGFWYLLSEGPARLNILTMLITGIAALGVFRQLKHHSKVHCACLGTFIRLPLNKISLVEDVAMFVMATAMLALNFIR